ncbi:MAG TPA: IPT/TIG domain-containing protein [Thermoanaerobaculia bacterium]|nr:IPT/TIG domain-containing protein [Thermoanaerobaculia bacterium]
MNPLRKFLSVVLPAALLALAACTSDSPSEPRVDPVPPVPPAPQVTFNITVTASPSTLAIGSGQSSTITVRAVRADTGQPPANLTPITLATSLGTFGSATGDMQITLQLTNGTAQTVLFPGSSSGVATVRATLDSSEGFANVQIGAGATFFISFVQPSIIDPQGGETATIQGGGFESPVRVTIGNANVQVLSVAPDRIRIVTPSAAQAGVNVGAGQAVPVTVGVTINVNEPEQKSDSLNAGVTYATGGGGIQPVITSVTPSSGSNDGGTRITINGSGFQSPVQVFFEGGSPRISVEAPVESAAANRVIVLSPAARGFGQGLQNQSVDIRVKNINSGFEGSTTGGFRYGSNVLITAVGPTEVVYNQQEQVVIQGQGFDEPLTVSLAGVAASVQQVTGTRIVVRSPVVAISSCSVPSGQVSVVNIETGDGANFAGPFRFRPITPVITSISPDTGSRLGGTTVEITSAVSKFTGFDIFGAPPIPIRVLVNSQPAPLLSAEAGRLRITTPAFTGTFPTRPCTVGNQTGTQMLPAPVPVTVTNLNTGCSDTIANGFTYQPETTDCIIPPPPPPTAPVANFSFFPLSAATHTVQLTDTSTGNPTTWQWDFTNDGSFDSSAQNPQFNYPAAGSFATRLRVSNAAGSDEVVLQVTAP